MWNVAEPSILLSGSYDRTVAVTDIRNAAGVKQVKVDSDIECVRWCHTHPFMFLASTEKGTVTLHDARKLDKPLFTLAAHDGPCSAVSWNTKADPPMFATSSVDKTVKLWTINDGKPGLLASKDLKVGAVFSMQFADRESPFFLCAAGSKGKVGVWDTFESEEVSKAYPGQDEN